MSNWFYRCLILGSLSGFALGCTPADPQFEDLTSIPKPTFFGSEFSQKSVSGYGNSIAVSGQCSKLITTLQFRIENRTAWAEADSSLVKDSLNIDCANSETFSFNMLSLQELGFAADKALTVNLQVRAYWENHGESQHSTLALNYVPVGQPSPKGFRITAGGGASSSPSLKMKGSLGFKSNNLATSTSFKMKSGIRK